MAKVSASVQINAPKNKVWEVVADFGGVYNYNPNVPKSWLINGSAKSGLGADRHCDLSDDGKLYVNEKVIEWNEGEGYVVSVYKSTAPFPVTDLKAYVDVKAKNASETIVTVTFGYKPKYGIVGALMNQFMLKGAFTKMDERLLAGIKYHIETGNEVASLQTLRAAGMIA